jgi:predicted ArsR family transcriptional regulator
VSAGEQQRHPEGTVGVVFAALAEQGWRTSAELADETGLVPLAVRLALTQLHSQGLVRRSIRGGWRTATSSTAPPPPVERRS